MTMFGGFKSFFMQGLAFLVVGYMFYFGFTNYYPQYADNWLYLGILAVIFILLSGFAMRIIGRRR